MRWQGETEKKNGLGREEAIFSPPQSKESYRSIAH